MPVFDSNTDYNIPVRTMRGLEKILVRCPSDEEWSDWYKSRQMKVTDLGRGQNVWRMDGEQADLKLYERIRSDGMPDLDTAEAQELIGRMSRCEVRGIESLGDEAEITVEVLGGETKHRVRIPTAKQAAQFRRSSSQMISLPFGKQRVKMWLEPGVKLWEECFVSTSGYDNGPVPAIHKDSVMRSLLHFIESEADEGNP